MTVLAINTASAFIADYAVARSISLAPQITGFKFPGLTNDTAAFQTSDLPAPGSQGETNLVGVYGDDSHAPNAGAVYLFGVETFVPGLVADTVRSDSVTSANLVVGSVTSSKLADGAVQTDKLADGAVTSAKLDPAIGVWTRSGNDVFRLSGNVGVGTGSPQAALQLRAPDGS